MDSGLWSAGAAWPGCTRCWQLGAGGCRAGALCEECGGCPVAHTAGASRLREGSAQPQLSPSARRGVPLGERPAKGPGAREGAGLGDAAGCPVPGERLRQEAASPLGARCRCPAQDPRDAREAGGEHSLPAQPGAAQPAGGPAGEGRGSRGSRAAGHRDSRGRDSQP